MKKFYYFFVLCLYILGAIGGFGYCVYAKAYLIAIAVLALAAMAFPYAKQCFKNLIA